VTPAELAALCAAAMPGERLSEAELAHICFGAGDAVIGDDGGAAAFTTKRVGDHVAVWLLLVAVRPDLQGRGRGKQLVGAVLEQARSLGARHVHLANAVPRYVWPGVELTNTRAGMLCESFGFERNLLGINMTIPTTFRCDPPPGLYVERETGSGALEFAQRAFPHWVDELTVAIERGTAFAARDEQGTTVGFGCHSCNRAAWIGPMATDPGAQRGGVGSAVLGGVCADLEARGHATGEIAWVSTLRFYGKCGATVSRIFQGGSLRLV